MPADVTPVEERGAPGWYRIRKARQVFDHVTCIYKLILDGFEKHVPLGDRHVTTSAVGRSGLWLGELSGRLPVVRRRGAYEGARL